MAASDGSPSHRRFPTPARLPGDPLECGNAQTVGQKIVAQNGECALCNEKFSNYSDIVPDHINPRGMGGAWRDDHPENIQAVHWWCNEKRGRAEGEVGTSSSGIFAER